VLTDVQRGALRDLCDTVVPGIERDPDPGGIWGRSASDYGTDNGVEQMLAGVPDPEVRGGLLGLLDAFAVQQLGAAASQEAREAIVAAIAESSPEAAAGVGALVGMTLFLHYGAPEPATGLNPAWEAYGFPGPPGPPPDVPKTLPVLEPSGEDRTLEADVCIVGSGSGGGVIAAHLAEQGLDVVVLEASGYFNESDFTGYELQAYESMFWRGGPTPTVDGNVTLQAGMTLGGGTTINWTNCLRTRDWVREEWARQHGLEGVDGPEYDEHLDAVMERLGANDRCSDLNGTQERLKQGAEQLGWSFETIVRNADPRRYSAETAGFMGFGDFSGSKQSGDRTFLADAAERGARLAVRARAQRILVESGRAAGVEALTGPPEGPLHRLTVKATRVVVACGSLESPALLMRSGIGGPAVGKNLRLHPCTAVFGTYGEDTHAWMGPPQAGLVDEFAETGEGYGFLVETAQYAPGLIGSALPWTGAAAHKEMMEQVRFGGTFISLTRDRGGGEVAVDAAGEAVPSYAVTDELDLANLRKGIEVQMRLHEAAGAEQIHSLSRGLPSWRRGDDLDAAIASAQSAHMGAGGQTLFSAHQMGSCRMGTHPETSVADPWGELHDTPGVWIGDGSAFPSASGTNPMITIMALARRTAGAIAAAV
jgi:choline dehydrogenase-like flavoprotein